MRADRLLSILLLMQGGGKWTVRELARRLEVSERTVVRDLEALAAAGVPVYAERGNKGGWRLAEGYRTTLNGLNPDDIRLLLMAQMSRMFEDLGKRRETDLLLDKFMNGMPPSTRKEADMVRERIHVDGAGWSESMEKFPHLPVLYEAVWNERTVCIVYRRGEETVERELQPLGLVAKGNTWYVAGVVDGEIRTYRVSRVAEVRECGKRFDRPERFDLSAYWERSSAEFRMNLPSYGAKVRMRASVVERFAGTRFVKLGNVEEDKEGWVTVCVDFQAIEYGCAIVLGFGADIEVMEPAELRRMVKSAASEILRLYKK
ncbi:helix-turn-helix transcriptional regulator [Paenibacillus alkalitolerans]|uniref:helix-turn-helix transcriptional regulator n=1 Tax=Paenibacillus alkalitolerans TaxID=2799335 RepID=UPI0018F75D78|nr:YafY family protein [Paenibacillus alkalitolerans]